MTEYFDMLIVGAGISGIGAARRLQQDCPRKRFVLLESRASLGGTWDLFRYPGLRSDSDMYTLGYDFKPWPHDRTFADGATILQYLRETAAETGIDHHIRYRHRVVAAAWSSEEARWRLTVECGEQGESVHMSCGFLIVCGGYYDYEAGYTPDFPGQQRYRGRVVHPQAWPEDLDYRDKRVVIIGSGATAVTLVPAMAEQAAHVTMLQRSPTYVMAEPGVDRVARWLHLTLPSRPAYLATRWKRIVQGVCTHTLRRRWPALARTAMLKQMHRQWPAGADAHFTPRHAPYEQRVCLAPDGDMFRTIRSGRASVVTDHIDTFTETGVKLRSGAELAADVIVTATGLRLKMLGGIAFYVNGRPVDWSQMVQYKGVMYGGVPNLVSILGYTTVSWTLKADLASAYACRLLRHMDRTGAGQCMPRPPLDGMPCPPLVQSSAGYIQRARDLLPRQGTRRPWKFHQNYPLDILVLKLGRLDDGIMEFGPA